MSDEDLDPIVRWRLSLGDAANTALGGLSGNAGAMDAALSWLYGRENEGDGRGIRADCHQGK